MRSRIAYACFHCRISLKRDRESNEVETCSRCSGSLYRMGWSFKAPPQSDSEQWQKVQLLYAHGFRFIGSGHHTGESFPARLRDVLDFIERNPDHPLRVASMKPELML